MNCLRMRNFILAGFGAGVAVGCAFAASPPYSRSISFNFTAPDLKVYISDSSGHRTGIDPDVPLGLDGQQKVAKKYHTLEEIPDSGASQENFGENNPKTGWEISIREPLGEYVLNYSTGMENGGGSVLIGHMNYQSRIQANSIVSVLASRRYYKQIGIDVKADGKYSFSPRLRNGDLVDDTKSACERKDIGPESACRVLMALARSIEKKDSENQIEKKRKLKLFLKVLARLHVWEKQDRERNWGGFESDKECEELLSGNEHQKFFAKDPGYSALKLDA